MQRWRLYEKVLWILKRAWDENDSVWKRKFEVINKWTAGIIWKCQHQLYLKDKNYCKVRDHCHYIREYRGGGQSICYLKYSVPKKIPIVFHNGSNCDYHLIINELAK